MISLILLGGGTGSRMKSATPKQFLSLGGKPLIFHSLEVFLQIPEIDEIIVVCSENYQDLFSSFPVKFALPGKRRQDSVYNGLQQVSKETSWVMTHDGVRPFISMEMIQNLITEGIKVGAATLGMPVKPTIKECNDEKMAQRTPPREFLWEIQTPQLLSKKLYLEGFKKAQEDNLTVTEDTMLAEALCHPVKLVEGSYTNLKITTPEDIILAEAILNSCLCVS